MAVRWLPDVFACPKRGGRHGASVCISCHGHVPQEHITLCAGLAVAVPLMQDMCMAEKGEFVCFLDHKDTDQVGHPKLALLGAC